MIFSRLVALLVLLNKNVRAFPNQGILLPTTEPGHRRRIIDSPSFFETRQNVGLSRISSFSINYFRIQKNHQSIINLTSGDDDTKEENFLKLIKKEEENIDLERRQNGILVLYTVPMAWGTFEPAVRYVYDVQPDIPAFLFSLCYYFMASSSLLLLALFWSSSTSANQSTSIVTNIQETATTTTTSSCDLESVEKDQLDRRIISNMTTTMMKSNEGEQKVLPIRGGIELGTYLFIGNGFQVVGLKTIPSDRAAFLLQLTTLFVPIVESILAKNIRIIPVRTWIACSIALVGVGLIGLDDATNNNDIINDSLKTSTITNMNELHFSIGDVYVAMAALFYTFHCIRLERYAKETPAIELAAAKATTETVWCAIWIISCIIVATTRTAATTTTRQGGGNIEWIVSMTDAATTSGQEILHYVQSFRDDVLQQVLSTQDLATLFAVVAWVGLVTIAYTIYAQSYGQSRVKPSTANLIYTIQPFFTALIAFVVLGESLGPMGYIGGALIGGSVLLVI